MATYSSSDRVVLAASDVGILTPSSHRKPSTVTMNVASGATATVEITSTRFSQWTDNDGTGATWVKLGDYTYDAENHTMTHPEGVIAWRITAASGAVTADLGS